MKYILVIGDGMADLPLQQLEGKTPLQAANIPCMDALANKAEIGRANTVPAGVPAGSDTAILSIFGYDPRKYYTGRSPLEAAGSGVELKTGNVSFRCNLVTLTEEEKLADRTIVSHSGGSVEGEEAIGLMQALEKDAHFADLMQKLGLYFKINPMFRHIAVMDKADITGLVNTPPHEVLGENIAPYLPRGCELAAKMEELMNAAFAVLNDHPINAARRARGALPANCIWLWGEGTAIELPSFVERTGKYGKVISAVPLVQGIGALAGLASVVVPGANGDLDTNYEGKVQAALDILKENELVFVHLEAPDECTHNGNLPGKIQAIEWLDSRIIKPIVDSMQEDFRLLVMSDHYTLMKTRGHDGTPVPYLLYDSRKDTALNRPFCEATAADGPYFEEGATLIRHFLEV